MMDFMMLRVNTASDIWRLMAQTSIQVRGIAKPVCSGRALTLSMASRGSCLLIRKSQLTVRPLILANLLAAGRCKRLLQHCTVAQLSLPCDCGPGPQQLCRPHIQVRCRLDMSLWQTL